MIEVTRSIQLDERELDFDFVTASGPGGQNVNKVSTAVRMKFDIRHSPSIPDHIRERLEKLCGRRLNQDGVLLIAAQRFRSQIRNREDAIERLVVLIREAAIPQITRRPTKPTKASRRRRLEDKGKRSEIKKGRGGITLD